MKLLSLLLTVFQPVDSGLATKYGYEGDRYDNVGSFACEATLTSKFGTKVWKHMKSKGIAHRTLECGTELYVCKQTSNHNKQCIQVYVVDRGPYGAVNGKGAWHVRMKLKANEQWRGVVDLLPEPSKKLQFSGLDKVSIWKLPSWTDSFTQTTKNQSELTFNLTDSLDSSLFTKLFPRTPPASTSTLWSLFLGSFTAENLPL